MAMQNMTIRVDGGLKSEASEVAEYYGFDLSTVTRAFYKEMVDSQSIPLDLARRRYVPIGSEEEALDVADDFATEMVNAVVDSGSVGRVIDAPKRMGVTELARSQVWREELATVGCIEIVGREGTIGYMLSPDYVCNIDDRMYELELHKETRHIEAIFGARRDRKPMPSGSGLAADAAEYFDAHAGEMEEAVFDD